MNTLPAAIWLDLLSKPYRFGARGPHEYDCVGLMLEIERRLGREIPPWGSRPRLLHAAKEQWERTDNPQPGDGILIHSTRPKWHIGVVTGGGYMIHAHQDIGYVVRERYNAFPWHNRIEGFYRWIGTMEAQS